MLFNSLSFFIFLPIVFLLYWFLAQGKMKLQNVILLVSSYFFYASWDFRFLFLLLFSTFLAYCVGIVIDDVVKKNIKLFFLYFGILLNVFLLGIFKYYNFFSESGEQFLSIFGFNANFGTVSLVLPVGISFYTFHSLSYLLDVYNKKIKSERNFIRYALFVSFFPLLIAGPIERATHLLPQFSKERVFDYHKMTDGLRQILWGLFKKIVIADNCATYANIIFNNSDLYSGSTLFLGALFFTFQIYCDFSGYSDIALGVARLFGFDLLRNFAFPYFSKNFTDFWKRWHISLTSWFRDYVYIPFGGNRISKFVTIRNTFLVFLISGLWHGPNWTFITWGFLHALYLVPSILFKSNKKMETTMVANNTSFTLLKDFFSTMLTFLVTVMTWIFFRADNMHHALSYMMTIFSFSFFSIPYFPGISNARVLLFLIFFFLAIEWLGKKDMYAIERIGLNWPRSLRWGVYYIFIVMIFYFSGSEQQFIYFQF